jgi:hypothetical protein
MTTSAPSLPKPVPGPDLINPGQHFPGENRNFGQGSYIDLEPDPYCWQGLPEKLRLTPKEVDRLRSAVCDRANWRCELCECKPNRKFLGTRWYDDEDIRKRVLVRLLLMCTICFQIAHIAGVTEELAPEKDAELRARAADILKRRNGWSDQELDVHAALAQKRWEVLSSRGFELDPSLARRAVESLP